MRRIGAALIVAAALAGTATGTAAASGPPVYKQLSYGPSAGEKGTVFASATAGSPIVVLVHGGGWRLQGKEIEESTQAKALQLQGFTVFDVNYDQDSPTTPAFPLQVEEIETAVRWIVSNAAKYHGNETNVVMLGGSAGGQLVAMAAELLDAERPGTVAGVASLSGPYDFQTLVAAAESKEIKDRNYVTSIGQALGCPGNLPACSPAFEEAWSPTLHIPAAGSPSWLLVSSQQYPVDTHQAEEMRADLQAAGCSVAMLEVATSHGFYLWSEVATQVYEFIRAT